MRLFEAVRSRNREIVHIAALLEDSTAGDPENRRRLLEALRTSMEEHVSIDEDIVFPVFIAAEHRNGLIARSRVEALEIRRELEEVMRMPANESGLKYRIASLTNRVRTYMAHETDELLAQAHRLLPEDEELALGEVAARRHKILAQRIQKP